MSEIIYKEEKEIEQASLINLYHDAGWVSYTKNPQKLKKAVENSFYVLTAYDGDKLVGLIRIISDGLTIVYIQDVLVLKSYKRKKIGTTLVTKVLDKFKNIRQKVLLTDDIEETRSFYQSLGFKSCDKGNLISFTKF